MKCSPCEPSEKRGVPTNMSLELSPKVRNCFEWGPVADRLGGSAIGDAAAQLNSMLDGRAYGAQKREIRSKDAKNDLPY